MHLIKMRGSLTCGMNWKRGSVVSTSVGLLFITFALETMVLESWPWWVHLTIALVLYATAYVMWRVPEWKEKRKRPRPAGMHVESTLRATLELIPDEPPSLRKRIGSFVKEVRKCVEGLERWLLQ